jgi:thiopurine S-methyltransferase
LKSDTNDGDWFFDASGRSASSLQKFAYLSSLQSVLKDDKMVYSQAAFKFGRLAPVAFAGLAGSYSIAAAPTARSNCEPSKEQSDNLNRWYDRWSTGKTQWHRTKVHHSLEEKLTDNTLTLPKNARILVPLCGKTVDMAYLAHNDQVKTVVGVDGIRKALDEFASENPDLQVKAVAPSRNFKFEQLKGKSILLLKGDFFDLDAIEAGGKFDVVWDRAAFVAIRPELRQAYVDVMGSLVKKGGQILLSTWVRPGGDITKGPPFSMDEATVRDMYEDEEWVDSVELIDSKSLFGSETWYKAIFIYFRLGNVTEKTFLIRAKK